MIVRVKIETILKLLQPPSQDFSPNLKHVVIFHHQTVVFGSNSRRNYIESFFNGFLKLYEIVGVAFFHTFDAGNCMISFFGVGKFKLAFSVYGGQPWVTLPFPAFLLVLIGFLSKTAQKPLKNRSHLA